MNKQKLISILQSRLAKRRKKISHEWFIYSYEGCEYDYDMWDRIGAKEYGNRLGLEQKEDKQILKQLVEDARGHKLQAMYYKNLSDYTKQVERKLASYTMTAKLA